MEKRFFSFFKANVILYGLILLLVESLLSCNLNIDDLFFQNFYPDEEQDYNSEATVKDFYPSNNEADVIFICYMDGDNNLVEPIWQDLNEIEYGLSLIEEGSYSNADVDIIVLWDGENNEKESSHANTSLYKIGPDKRIVNNMPYQGLSKKTLDLTKTADFIFANGKQEVSMSDPKTLENLLIWVKNHYSIEENTKIILHFADHGGGPRSVVDSRAMCQDDDKTGYRQDLLYTKDIPIAIKNSGIGKIDLVIQDVCNGSNIEEAYEYKDVANYMLVSPNEMPGYGLNYHKIIPHLSEGDCIHNGVLDVEQFLGKAVSEFIDFYKRPESYWISLANEIKKLIKRKNDTLPISDRIDESIVNPLLVSLSDKNVHTITALKLENVQKLQNDIKNLVTELNNPINEYAVFNHKKFDYFYALQNGVFLNMDYYEGHSLGDLVTYYKFGEKESVYSFKFNYATTFANLYDIGVLTDFIKSFNNLNENGRSIITTYADEVINSLKSVILYSWRDGSTGALYNKSNNQLNPILNVDNKSCYYGLTISGPGFYYKNTEPKSIRFPGFIDGYNPTRVEDKVFYTRDLLFGKDTQEWDLLMHNIIDCNKIKYSE